MVKNHQMYLKLLKSVLTDLHRIDTDRYKPLFYSKTSNWKKKILFILDRLFRTQNFAICEKMKYKLNDRINGRDWPLLAETMIGIKRLDNLERCILDVINNNIKGDLIECGVWRGGASIFMKAVLKVLDAGDRIVWVADSFEGLPKPNSKEYPADENDSHYSVKELAIPLEVVKDNFRKYDLLDNVRFIKGWFKDTLFVAPIEKLAILRIDGDMYESTINVLTSLYPKLSIGGYVIIDDYGLEACKKAVEDYRQENNINEEIKDIDSSGVYWKKLL